MAALSSFFGVCAKQHAAGAAFRFLGARNEHPKLLTAGMLAIQNTAAVLEHAGQVLTRDDRASTVQRLA